MERKKKKIMPELQNAAQKTFYRLSRCQNVLTKRPYLICFSSQKLRFVIFQVLSLFEKSFVIVWVFEFCHILSLVIFLVIEFCHNLSFWFLSHFEFLSFVPIWAFDFLSQFDFLSFITIWFFKVHHNLCFWVSSPF